MKKKTKSLLEEINSIYAIKDREHFIESKADNIIASTKNLIELINESYDEDTAQDLVKRLLNGIRNQNTKKFQRGIRSVNEN